MRSASQQEWIESWPAATCASRATYSQHYRPNTVRFSSPEISLSSRRETICIPQDWGIVETLNLFKQPPPWRDLKQDWKDEIRDNLPDTPPRHQKIYSPIFVFLRAYRDAKEVCGTTCSELNSFVTGSFQKLGRPYVLIFLPYRRRRTSY